MPRIKPIGITSSECPNPQWHPKSIGLLENNAQHPGPDAATLVYGANVEMLEVELVRGWFDCHEADTLAVEQHVTSTLGREAIEKSLTRSLGVKPPDAFQTFAHGLDADANELLEVIQPNRAQGYPCRIGRLHHGQECLN